MRQKSITDENRFIPEALPNDQREANKFQELKAFVDERKDKDKEAAIETKGN